MIFAPPRHGKSEFVSKYFPAWYLGTYPDRRVIMASHNADLAEGFGEQARDILERWGPTVFGRKVRTDSRAKGDWKIAGCDGAMESFGVNGGMLGKGADLLIIDDPFNGSKDANSAATREAVWEWFMSTGRNRLNPGGHAAIILMQQRLNIDDLAGRLLERFPDRWTDLTLRAEAEEDDILGRKPGEWLWPWGFPVQDYEELREGNEYWWASQYQQRPVPRGGGMFQRDWFEGKIVREAPSVADARVRWWDKATTKGKGDYTAGVRMSRVGHKIYIETVRRGQWAGDDRDVIIRDDCKADNDLYPHEVVTWGEQEPGSAGKDAATAFERMLAPYAVHTERSSGSKEVRADAFSGACQRGDVYLVQGDYVGAFLDELCSFPNGKHDDQVDAASGAYNKLALSDGGGEAGVWTPGKDEDLVGAFEPEGVAW